MLNTFEILAPDMDIDVLNCLLRALPLHSEEDCLREEIPERELLDQLPGEHGAGVLLCVRRAFEACALLDQRLLDEGKWAFVSFPAALFGHSLLQTLATPGQQIFESDYWRSPQDSAIEEQRLLLKELESRRVRLHAERSAEPIRFVFVAWALICLGGKFLLHHREDRTRPSVKNYVLPGGRFKPGDLSRALQKPKTLRELHASGSRVAIDALPQTLSRELFEELGLHLGEDCHASSRVVLEPYRRIEGSQNNHAFTEYVLALYDVSLTAEGEARLLERIAESGDTLVWFSIEDLVDPTGRTDGRRAFIDALVQQYGEKLSDFLADTPSSSTTPYRFNHRAETVEIPGRNEDPLLIGETGKERPRNVGLSEEGHALLMLMAVHSKALKLELGPEHLLLLPGGWIKLVSERSRYVVAEMQAHLAAADFPLLQQVGETFVRVSVVPELLFLGEELFCYRLRQTPDSKGEVSIDLKLPASVWSETKTWSLPIPIAPNMLRSLEAIEGGSIGPGDLERFAYSDETMKKNCKEMLDEKSRTLGLRKLVRQANKLYMISVSRMDD